MSEHEPTPAEIDFEIRYLHDEVDTLREALNEVHRQFKMVVDQDWSELERSLG